MQIQTQRFRNVTTWPDGSSLAKLCFFGSQRDKDRHYNTPRAWDIQRFLNPEVEQDPQFLLLPGVKTHVKITIEDAKYVLKVVTIRDSVYDPYGSEGDTHSRRTFPYHWHQPTSCIYDSPPGQMSTRNNRHSMALRHGLCSIRPFLFFLRR